MDGFNRFPELAAQFGPVLSQMVRKAAFDLQAQAASRAPVDTGFLRNSIYTVTARNSTYGAAGAPSGDSYLLPEVAAPDDAYTAYVAVGANYGAFVNYGTRFQPAQPYWEPAVDAVMPSFEEALGLLESKLR